MSQIPSGFQHLTKMMHAPLLLNKTTSVPSSQTTYNTHFHRRLKEKYLMCRSTTMKAPAVVIISLFLFSVLPCEARKPTTRVLDMDGKTVKAGVKYYVVPVNNSLGGGLDLASSGRCPRSVILVGPKKLGSTILFYPIKSRTLVHNGTDVNIEFSDVDTGCPDSNVWEISHDPEDVETTHFVVSGGEKGNPTFVATSSWFMVLKTQNGYKFKFCPDAVCDCNPVCMDVGVSVNGGKRLLELGLSSPFEVNFKRA